MIESGGYIVDFRFWPPWNRNQKVRAARSREIRQLLVHQGQIVTEFLKTPSQYSSLIYVWRVDVAIAKIDSIKKRENEVEKRKTFASYL